MRRSSCFFSSRLKTRISLTPVFKNRLSTLFSWVLTFTSHSRSQLTTTSQWVYARLAMSIVEKQLHSPVASSEQLADELDQVAAPETLIGPPAVRPPA